MPVYFRLLRLQELDGRVLVFAVLVVAVVSLLAGALPGWCATRTSLLASCSRRAACGRTRSAFVPANRWSPSEPRWASPWCLRHDGDSRLCPSRARRTPGDCGKRDRHRRQLLALTRVQSLVYQVEAHDPWKFGFIVLTLVTAAVLAAWLPARRASIVILPLFCVSRNRISPQAMSVDRPR